ncbi:MAG TPA: hypothetical protein VK066_23700 [Chloroflexota bacterium]|nr:hypothetical protein [Chloroflexota bacterium]
MAFQVKFFAAEKRVLKTHLDPAECSRRIARLIADDPQRPGWARGPVEQYPVWGTVSSDRFRLVKRLRSYIHQPYQTRAIGHFVREPSGTRLVVGFGPPLHSILLAVGLDAFVICIAIAAGQIGDPRAPQALLGFLIFVGVVVLLEGGLYLLLRYAARGEARWLIQFLKATLDAHDLPPGRG